MASETKKYNPNSLTVVKPSERESKKHHKSQGFYIRCVCCDANLRTNQQERGVCQRCWADVVRVHYPALKKADDDYVDTMWRNPMDYNEIDDMFSVPSEGY